MHWIEKIESPIIFGHRGASKYAPENTLAAFSLALRQGAEAFELDTMLTADGIPVVIHDRTVDRTTDGTGKVDQLLVEQLRKLDAGVKFSQEYSGEQIPLLEEIFTHYKDMALINIELKNYHDPNDDLPPLVVALAKRMDVLDQVLFSSFLPSNLRRIKNDYPHAQVALLCFEGLPGFIQRSFLFSSISHSYINPQYNDVTKAFMKAQQNMHRKVITWTVDEREDISKLINLGVNGIITNDPKIAVEIKSELKKSH